MALDVASTNENASTARIEPHKAIDPHGPFLRQKNAFLLQPLQVLNPNTHGNVQLAIKRLLPVPRAHLRQPISPSDSSSDDEDEFFEASPVMKAASADLDSIRLHTLPQVFPTYEAALLLLLLNTYPSLIETTLVPVVHHHIVAHMSGPLLEDGAPLVIKGVSSGPSLGLVAPFCGLYEHGVNDHSDEGALLQILTEELEKLDAEDGSREGKLPEKRRSVFETIRSWFKFELTEEEYDAKYPWAKYIRIHDDQNADA